MTKLYIKGTKPWAEAINVNLTPQDIQRKYEEGFAGTYFDPEENAKFLQVAQETGGFTNVEDAAHAFGWADSFTGQLVVPFVHIMELLPGCLPGTAQARGDCVSHSNKNAILGTMVGEVVGGQADEVTGVVERVPEVPPVGLQHGALSTEVSYWYRRHAGDGWFCGAAATVSIKEAGAVVRKNYPEIGVDLTKYTGGNAGKWGRTPPPDSIGKHLRNNLIRTAAKANSFEGLRDNLGQGRFISSCGSEGFTSVRDKHGVSSRRGSWAHAMCYIGTDDRPEIVRLYGGPLVLVLNSWGNRWNSGPRDILDSAKYVPAGKKALWERLDIVNPSTGNIMVPLGSFWAKWSDLRSREALVYAGLNGWRQQKILSWGTDLLG